MFVKRSCKPQLFTKYSDSDLEEDIEIADENNSDGTSVHLPYNIYCTKITMC